MIDCYVQTEMGSEYDDVAKALHLMGHNVNPQAAPGWDRQCLAYGSIRYCREKSAAMIGDLDFLRCSGHYHAVADLLLSDDYRMRPFGDLQRAERFPYFLRPDSPSKPFSGGVVTDAIDLKSLCAAPDELCVVAGVRKILSEHRVLIVRGMAVICREYARDGGFLYEASVEGDASAADWAVKNVWPRVSDVCASVVIDVAHTRTGFRLIELNAPSCSGYYGADPSTIADSLIAASSWD